MRGAEFSDVPFLKRVGDKYQMQYAVMRRKSIEEERKAQMETYKDKGKGLRGRGNGKDRGKGQGQGQRQG